ncbi:MAG: Type 1 glutamine amidotransferase-like domain-containing protein, partial [Deltaproteobacteria bacterium]|nr:Type 1 glutamine amidotransferase-like domain-containing protein [Deltaproteobacteria bacterium]
GRRTVFIPTASLVEDDAFFVDKDQKALEKFGLEIDKLEVATASSYEIREKIKGADSIFVSGGNTFFLLQELRRTGADLLIEDHIQAGKLYISTSAGSIIMSPNIEYVKHMDDVAQGPLLRGDYTALGMVDFYLTPHCTSDIYREACEKIKAQYGQSLNLLVINDSQVVTVLGDQTEVLTLPTNK